MKPHFPRGETIREARGWAEEGTDRGIPPQYQSLRLAFPKLSVVNSAPSLLPLILCCVCPVPVSVRPRGLQGYGWTPPSPLSKRVELTWSPFFLPIRVELARMPRASSPRMRIAYLMRRGSFSTASDRSITCYFCAFGSAAGQASKTSEGGLAATKPGDLLRVQLDAPMRVGHGDGRRFQLPRLGEDSEKEGDFG